MKITVLHNISRDASYGLNIMFDQHGRFPVPGAHELVKVFEFVTSDLLSADDIFRILNVGDDPEYDATERERSLALAYRERRLRSLSVGDVLAFDSRYLACQSVGWREVPADELRILEAEVASRLVRSRYDFIDGEELSVTVPLEET